MLTPKTNKDFNPVDQSQEVLIPTVQVLMDYESMKLDETDNMNVIPDNFRKVSVHVISRTKEPKKPPKRSIKGKRFKWKIKKKKPKSDPEDMCSWLVDSKVAPLKRVNKRSWVEAKLKGTGALRRSVGKQHISFLEGARRAGVYGALRRLFRANRDSLWHWRVAQADMARRAEENFKSGSITVTCALRR
ncbi:hypothetical protein A2U01_0023453, partial [Trifolium medium]|nr:hypothetical protein [Trifolium medium]